MVPTPANQGLFRLGDLVVKKCMAKASIGLVHAHTTVLYILFPPLK
jgi:hypothetical protein